MKKIGTNGWFNERDRDMGWSPGDELSTFNNNLRRLVNDVSWDAIENVVEETHIMIRDEIEGHLAGERKSTGLTITVFPLEYADCGANFDLLKTLKLSLKEIGSDEEGTRFKDTLRLIRNVLDDAEKECKR